MPNAQNLEQVEELRSLLAETEFAFLTEFQGMTVEELNELRKQIRETGAKYKVFKNRLIGIAARDLEITGLEPFLHGSTAIATAQEPASVAKVLVEFAKTNEKLKIKGGILGKKAISTEDSEKLVDMPSRVQLYTQVVGTLNSPISGLANVLSGQIRQLANVIQAIIDQK